MRSAQGSRWLITNVRFVGVVPVSDDLRVPTHSPERKDPKPTMTRSSGHPEDPCVLVVEPDAVAAQRMAAALDGDQRGTDQPARRVRDACRRSSRRNTPCVVLGSLGELFEHDLADVELVICSVDLPDGTGLNALDFLRRHCPHVPVMLVGTPQDGAMAVEAIRGGAVDFITMTGHDLIALPLAVEKCLAHQRVKQENERLQRDLGDSLTELAVKNHQLQALVRQLEATARTDDLTGLPNRRSLNELLGCAWRQAVRNNRPLAFMMIDLDDFKLVNDRNGHLRGDEMLRELAKIIRTNCRQVDVPARYGGDEFCVLMPESEAHDVAHVARRILGAWNRVNASRPSGEPRRGISIGVAQIDSRRPTNSEELIRHADEALYAAKAAGKGCIMVRSGDRIHAVESPAREIKVGRNTSVAW